MHRFIEELKDFSKKADWVLLIMCLVTAGFGLIVIASAKIGRASCRERV